MAALDLVRRDSEALARHAALEVGGERRSCRRAIGHHVCVRAGAALLPLVLLVGACGGANGTRVGTRGASVSSTARSAWCVPTSREAAIARAMPGETAPGEIGAAKLVNGPELHTLSPAVTVFNGEFESTSLYWAVEITGPTGSVTVEAPGAGGVVGWAVYDIDARTGDIAGLEAGPRPKAPAWDALPDHSGACAQP
jgi:hypothetical protein